MRNKYWVLAASISIALPGQAANAQTALTSQAERVKPLRVASITQSAVFMIAGHRPAVRPTAPVTVWAWTFRRDEAVAGGITYDTSARLLTMDCEARTTRTTLLEAYRNGNLIHVGASTTPARVAKPGTVGESQIRMVCEPSFRPNAQVYADYLAARAAALTHFARQPAKPQTAQPAQSPAAQPAAPSGTGAAARAGGQLRAFHTTATFTMMTSARPPATRPTAPFTVWRWVFSRLVLGKEGQRYDATAYRTVVNCTEGTVWPVSSEHYRNGMFVFAEETKFRPYKPKPGTGEYNGFRTECEPGHNANARTYADYRAARAAVPVHDGLARPAAAPKPSAAAASTGEAERAGGPLRLVDAGANNATAVVGPAPSTRPTRPFEAWTWMFFREPRVANGRQYDTLATLQRVDCTNGHTTVLRFEAYWNGALDRKSTPSAVQAPVRPKPGTVGQARLRAACEPGFRPNMLRYANHKAARAAAVRHFASKKK